MGLEGKNKRGMKQESANTSRPAPTSLHLLSHFGDGLNQCQINYMCHLDLSTTEGYSFCLCHSSLDSSHLFCFFRSSQQILGTANNCYVINPQSRMFYQFLDFL
jgi:hypothetical protein